MNHQALTQPGAFVVGCNYWTSHAGTGMWHDWRPDVIEADLAQLAEAGLQVVRVFLLWPDFQPLAQLYTGEGRPEEVRLGEHPLPAGELGQAGLSAEMVARLAWFLDCAERHRLRLIVGLVTGWMSGRLFVPPALEARNVLTDPVALMWETRLVRTIVRRFRPHPAILAWDLGNECNVMAPVPSSAAAWAWTSAMANAIRAEDPVRPIVSGMHSLAAGRAAAWRIVDQGELTDVLTTHPYPIFTPYCDQDPINTLRPGLHATAESRLYADIGGRPCLAEELGTLGPMVASERVAADYVRMGLFSLWAHDCHGLVWWCAYDQGHLAHAPYDWHAYERELGLFRADRTPKPVLAEIARFRAWLAQRPPSLAQHPEQASGSLSVGQTQHPERVDDSTSATTDGQSKDAAWRLPPRITEAVCILTEGQDPWAVAYAAFILAKQAGFDLVFRHADQPLPDAGLYLLPSVRGGGGFSRRLWLELQERVRAGATLYLSHHDCMLSPFDAVFGLEVQTRSRRSGPAVLILEDEANLCAPAPIRLALAATSAEVLAREPDGNPAFTRFPLGAGEVYFLTFPIEDGLSRVPSAFHGPDAQPFWRIYQRIAGKAMRDRAVRKDLPQVGVTEHPLEDGRRIVVAINYSPETVQARLAPAPGWTATESWYGSAFDAQGSTVTVAGNDAAVLILTKNSGAY